MMNIPSVTKYGGVPSLIDHLRSFLQTPPAHLDDACLGGDLPSGCLFRGIQLYQRAILLVDPGSRDRIQRFYRRDDACRTLISRILPRMLLRQRGVPAQAISFASTQAGKPYITTPGIEPIGFNVSHDNALIAMAFAPGRHGPPPFNIGIDVMKVQRPANESFISFVSVLRSQLTNMEFRLLVTSPPDQGLELFFWMWTLKEAYTKALGLGLGFDFARIEYNIHEDVVLVDGKVPKGWHFTKFELSDGDDRYQGVAAEFFGGDRTEIVMAEPNWLVQYSAQDFVQAAIHELV